MGTSNKPVKKRQQKPAEPKKPRVSPSVFYRKQLIDFLSSPENDFVTRRSLAADVLHVDSATLYKYFKSEDLDAIELEALEIRRKRYAPLLSEVDKSLIKKATDEGDPAACKLVYQRFEGWKETNRTENTGKDGGPMEIGMSPEIAAKVASMVGGGK